ncbi:hypothetical protein [Thermogemmatispora aurantia]|uniref:hypothetical protein n=1 Tax=Thermogemmatispora aurantia TaxID=2045279 RepID=UPI00124E8A37|nr:hypothetical protein [Thermogemmatispora aurantia]
MSQISRVALLIFRGDPQQPNIWLLRDRRGAWLLPAAVCAAGAHTGKLALALLQSLAGSCPGQRLWLLGLWPPVAAYLALIPAPAQVVGGRWWPAKEAAALTSQQEAWLIRRASQWLEDEGARRSERRENQ